jgi:hypothetical protein
MRRMSFVDLVRSSVLPREYTCYPSGVNADPDPTFLKKFDVTGNFLVEPPSQIRTMGSTAGAVVWFPNRDGGTIVRYGIFGPTSGSITSGLSFGLPGLSQNNSWLVFLSPTPIPYSTSADEQTNISPSPTGFPDFRAMRVVGGTLRMSSDTVPIGNAAYNGELSCSALSDIRDVLLVGASSGNPTTDPAALPTGFVAGQTFDPTDMVQSAVTSKDGIKQVSGIIGVRTVLGPDVGPTFVPPNTDVCDIVCSGEEKVYQVTPIATFPDAANVYNLAGPVIKAGYSAIQLAVWISPWNTQVKDLDTAVPATVPYVNTCTALNNIYYQGCGLFDQLDLQVNVTAIPSQSGPGAYTVNTQQEFSCFFFHIYTSSFSNFGEGLWGTIEQSCSVVVSNSDQQPIPGQRFMTFMSNGHDGFSGTLKPYPTVADAPTGMYLGSWIVVQSTNIGTADMSYTDKLGWKLLDYGCSINARPHNLYQTGNLGPCRVLKWDGFTNGMVIRCDGSYYAETIASQRLQPFVQQGLSTASTMLGANALMDMAALYSNPNSPFRRVWTLREYDAFISTSDTWTADVLRGWVQDEECENDTDMDYRGAKRIRY